MNTDTYNRNFSPLKLPLTGVNIIEASAGTGKTYGLAALYARLIILEKKTIAAILVVTFTKAAAAELRSRLRERLYSILPYLAENTVPPAEEFVIDLLAALAAKNITMAEAAAHLKEQLRHFDEAAIETIHSFCQSLLRRQAFLLGAPFNIEVISSHEETLELLTADFFRRYLANDTDNGDWFTDSRINPATLYRQVKNYLQRPYLHLENCDTDQAKTELSACLRELDNLNKNWRQQIGPEKISLFQELLAVKETLHGGCFQQPTYDRLFSEDILQLFKEDANKFIKACNRFIFEDKFILNKAKDKSVLVQELFTHFMPLVKLAELWQQTEQLKNRYTAAVELKLITFLNDHLAEYKKTTNRRSFDDLLIDVATALNTATAAGNKLRCELKNTFDFVLIDEFQDTDNLQYGIFNELFIQSHTPIYLIGDPKQSIYSFRGADINAYLQAKNVPGAQCFNLDTNYRSHQDLISFINALFGNRPGPFLHPDIPYHPVIAARQQSAVQTAAGTPFFPVTVVKTAGGSLQWQRRQAVAAACAGAIITWLNGNFTYQGRALEAKDIAVLVTQHKEAQLIAAALKDRNLRSVRVEKYSIYRTPEAKTLTALLRIWRYSGFNLPAEELEEKIADNYPYLFSSELFNLPAEEIRRRLKSENACAQLLQLSQKCLELWEKTGIYAAFQYFSQKNQLETKLITAGKERVLTNYNQLVELLAAAELTAPNPYQLLQWLEKQRQDTKAGADKDTLRLESDENLIKIVTVHSAKGLQYPVVFCPFISENTQKKNSGNKHLKITQADNSQILSYSATNTEEEENDDGGPDAETIRLLYVALTRAAEALILLVSDETIRDDKNQIRAVIKRSPLYYLMPGEIAAAATSWHCWQQWQHNHHDLAAIVNLQAEPPREGAFLPATAVLTAAARACPLPVLNFTVSTHTSYSRLSKSLDGQNAPIPVLLSDKHNEAGENDSEENLPYSSDYPLTLLNFPQGAAVGSCWHEILENLDFQTPLPEQLSLIRQKIRQYGLDTRINLPRASETAVKITADLLTKLLACPLAPHLTIAGFAPETMVKELDFTLCQPGEFDLTAVNRWLETLNRPDLMLTIPTDYTRSRWYETYLSGFIDLTALSPEGDLYILDYKSNYLGPSATCYEAQFLQAAMKKHHYQLQAVIYALAMYRYSRNLQYPVRSFRVRYIFMRGINTPAKGIWHWDLSAASMAALEEYLRKH